MATLPVDSRASRPGGRRHRRQPDGSPSCWSHSSRPFTALDAAVEQELVALAFAFARQLVRRELKADPGQIVGIVRDALQSLPVATRDIKVHLNPADAKLVREHLPAVDQHRAWAIVEDPMLTRGGARVETATSQVDARLESRLGALVAELLGSDREGDRVAEAEQGPA